METAALLLGVTDTTPLPIPLNTHLSDDVWQGTLRHVILTGVDLAEDCQAKTVEMVSVHNLATSIEKTNMSTIKRRTFLKSSAIAVGITVIPSSAAYTQGKSAATSYAANERLNIAGIGVGGRGGSHVESAFGENLVAVCDASQGVLDDCLRHVANTYKERKIPLAPQVVRRLSRDVR